MDPLYYLIGCLAALAGLAVGWFVARLLDTIPAPGRPRPRRGDHRRRPRSTPKRSLKKPN